MSPEFPRAVSYQGTCWPTSEWLVRRKVGIAAVEGRILRPLGLMPAYHTPAYFHIIERCKDEARDDYILERGKNEARDHQRLPHIKTILGFDIPI